MGMRERYKNSWTCKILIAGAITVLVVQAALVGYQAANSPFDPFGKYPVQEVTNPKGPGGFAIVYGIQDVEVDAIKCNKTDEVIQTFGSTRWVTVLPAGTSIATSSNAPGEVVPGCDPVTFSNPIPVDVLERTKQLEASGRGPVLWSIKGYEQPIAPDGDLGVGRAWQTEPFVIIP